MELSVWSLMPAVSIIVRGIPLQSIASSIVSVVVPAMSVTIALFLPRITLRSEDFPTLGFPIIATFKPFCKILLVL